MVTRSSFSHLRFQQGIFLSPVLFYAALAFPPGSLGTFLLAALILLLGIFPASNSYNSFYDRDLGSIGGLERPPPVEPGLLSLSLGLELVALMLALCNLGAEAALGLFVYGIISKCYSHPSIRLKAMPWVSTLVVAFFQGPWIYVLLLRLIPHRAWGTSDSLAAAATGLMIASLYPLTQVFQHDEDAGRGDLTLSRELGVRGTMLWVAVGLTVTLSLIYYVLQRQTDRSVFLVASIPAMLFYLRWFGLVMRDPAEASFRSTHLFLSLITLCTNLAFAYIYWSLWYGTFST